jgi:ATP-binding cassette subfamily G (WHITE) protein 2 (PDR)
VYDRYIYVHPAVFLKYIQAAKLDSTTNYLRFTNMADRDIHDKARPESMYTDDISDMEEQPGFTAISEARVADLARQISHTGGHPDQLSRISTAKTLVDVNPFIMDSNSHPELDPSNPKFNARQWVKTLMHHHSSNNGDVLRAGFSFRNLNVHGFGTPTDFQKDSLNILYSIPSLLGLGGNKKTKIQILRNFEGVVSAGEMLVVLGRPGSGCSTFLKTVAGETHGFHVGDGSVLNYQGITPETMHTRFRGEVVYQAETDGMYFPVLDNNAAANNIISTLPPTYRRRYPKICR